MSFNDNDAKKLVRIARAAELQALVAARRELATRNVDVGDHNDRARELGRVEKRIDALRTQVVDGV